jgi:murein DD-endopeptidase MepM/ murein hydrolase activator NlpD
MNGFNRKSYRKKQMLKGKGFYIALGVCLLSVGAAAFNTYKSVKDFSPQTQELNEEESNADDEKGYLEIAEYNDKEEAEQVDSKTSKMEIIEEKSGNIDGDKIEENAEKTNAAPQNAGAIVYPMGKKIIKDYSQDKPVYSKTLNDWRVHNAIDFEAEQGEKVKAITDGVVKSIENDPLLGTKLIISHNGGIVAYYSGLGSTTLVKPKDKIITGQEIGSVNNVPSETADGYHLHFAIKKQGKWVNPSEVIGQD